MGSARSRVGLLGCAAVVAVVACRGGQGAAAASPAPAPTPAPAYVPGLGELMTLQQMRHAKLWWAGEAGNWKLASYELDELQEGFNDVVRYHPTHKDSPVPIDQVVPKIMNERIAGVGDAIAKKDPKLFSRAYDALTEGCNSCHQATNFGFNVVRRPAVNTFSNQSFAAGDARDR
ncbi:MAG: hypothetical protein ACM3SU_12550 [Acidobacteriota bacterium]